MWHRVELPPVTPVDTTGAGDCFNAGLIAGLLRGLALPDAAALGCAVGALSTQAPGGTASCPDLASALALARTATVRRVSAGDAVLVTARVGVTRDQGRSSAFSGCRPPFIRSVKISAAAASG